MTTTSGANPPRTTGSSGVGTLHHWVGGADHEGPAGRFSDVTNPASGEVTGFPQNV